MKISSNRKIILAVSSFLVLLNSDAGKDRIGNSKRLYYEHHLNSLFKKNLVLKESKLQSICETGPTHPELAAFQEFIMTQDPELKLVPTERRIKAVNKGLEFYRSKQLKIYIEKRI